MHIYVGLDVGSVGVKAALLVPRELARQITGQNGNSSFVRKLQIQPRDGRVVFTAPYLRHRGRSLDVVRQVLVKLLNIAGSNNVDGLTITGSGGNTAAAAMKMPRCNEFQAMTRGIGLLYPQVRTVFEIGGESSKFLRLEPDPISGILGILDYSTNGDCAAGTGGFLDQQAGRLKYAVENIGEIVAKAARAAQIAGRCSVFAKSDMIHSQQKGFTPPEVLRGLCNAVAVNYRSAVVKGRTAVAPIAFVGGVSANSAVVQALRETFELNDGRMFVPEGADSLSAIGAAIIAEEMTHKDRGLMRSQVTTFLEIMAKSSDSSDKTTAACEKKSDNNKTVFIGNAKSQCTTNGGMPTADVFPTSPPLSMKRVKLLRDCVKAYVYPENGEKVDAFLGLDIGSVGTKLVLIDREGDVIHSIFTRTEGRPIEVVTRALRELQAAVGSRVEICGVGSTGSGRELIGELVGADSINDEITCHKTGAAFIGDRLLGKRPDTIFEIGGQDSKYISLETEVENKPEHGRNGNNGSNGKRIAAIQCSCDVENHEQGCVKCSSGKIVASHNVGALSSLQYLDEMPLSRCSSKPQTSCESIVVDFTMNEACAAGTGSFLEERAEELGVSIKGEFSQLALGSKAPIRLGERCTVFMERDVNTYMQRGAKREDVIAGLAYSVGYNYINRVVRGRRIGDCVFFQGGTAFNDSVAAAFAAITGKEIIVPPHNEALGAIGAALLAKEKTQAAGISTRFRGFDISQVNYGLREFTCKGCGNLCSVQEFSVEGEKTFWGDKCSDRYRKRAKTNRKPAIPDLIALRKELMAADDTGDPTNPKAKIGLPMAMYSLDLLPLWRRFWRDCGFAVITSGETNRRIVQLGLDASVAEPCFPIIVAHGHAAILAEQGVDYIWIPNILNAETKFLDNMSHVCPWGQTLPFVIRQSPAMREWKERILCPKLEFRHGLAAIKDTMVHTATKLGVAKSQAESAFEAAAAVQSKFKAEYEKAGCEALETLRRTGETGLIIVGRPYNVHDAGLNISVNRKLREFYGANLIPIDALPTMNVDIRDINNNMYWEYGRKILAAAKIVGEHSNLHMIYITNFKCGPDSYVKGFVRPASGKPFLTLQFDGHSNDAGMMTRCEAYLDSKGILRWWRQEHKEAAGTFSRDERSTSPKCPIPAPG